MLRSSKVSTKFLAGALGLGVIGILAACSPETGPDATSEVPAEAPETTTEIPAADPEVPAATEDSPAIGEDPVSEQPLDSAAGGTVAEVVEENESFNTLEQAIQAAGLEETLSEPGPYTVFAPTDEAFAALPPEVLEQLLNPENQDQLRQILAYHVVPGEVTSPNVTPGEISTVAGEPITVEDNAGELSVSGANVIQPDITASNGVVHAIDQVLLPPSLQVQ